MYNIYSTCIHIYRYMYMYTHGNEAVRGEILIYKYINWSLWEILALWGVFLALRDFFGSLRRY